MELGSENVELVDKGAQPEETPKLSRIEALEVGQKTVEEPSEKPNERPAAPTGDPQPDTAISANDTGTSPARADHKPPTETIEPPAEWSKEEKQAFFEMDARGRAAALRIAKAQQQYHSRKLEEIRAKESEIEWGKKFVDQVQTFYRARGERPPSPEDIIKWGETINKITVSPEDAFAEILRAQGREVPEALAKKPGDDIEEKIKRAVHEATQPLASKLAQAERAQIGQTFSELGAELQSATNAAGGQKFPDFNDSESGIKLASLMGSLISGQHEHSAGFAAYIQARVPEAQANPRKLLEEAYKWFGGRVDESAAAPRSSDPQKHLIKSNLAASSIPGRGVSSNSTSGAVKKVSRLEALRRGAEELRG